MLTDEEIADLFAIHDGPIAQAGRKERAQYFDDTRTWVDPNGYRLSDRLWNTREDLRRELDQMVQAAIATGEDAIKTSKEIERFLNPAYAPIRNSKGRIIRDKRRGVLTATPRDGLGSFPSRRLMRTEISRAHGEAAKAVAKKMGTAIRWRLSGSHPKPDQCDENAQGSSKALPAGCYWVNEIPAYPNHPQDLCHLQHFIQKSDDDLIADLRHKYELDTPDERSAYEESQRLIKRAQASEEAVTDALQAIGLQVDGNLEGLQYRLKTISSTQRKLLSDMAEKRISAREAADGLFDNLRYTYTLPESTYGAGVTRATEELGRLGYKPKRVKNFWKNDDGYTAVQGIWETPSGTPFELQFHTERTLYTKEKISHPLYEKVRVLDKVKDADEILRLNTQIDDAWKVIRSDPPNLAGLIDDDLLADIKYRYNFFSETEARAYEESVKLLQRARAAEPAVTDALQAIGGRIDGNLEGLAHRLKTTSSTQRKLLADMQEKNIGAGEAANGLFDNLRYTYTLPEGSYGAAVREATEDLIARGYQPKRLKNFWANEDGYTAVQGVFETAEGVPFELQFHTERTLYTKEKISHPLYEKVRVLDEFEDSAEIIRLNRAIDEAWKAIRADPPALDGITEAVARVKK